MGYDRKYGKITTEFGSIGEDEPVVVFRAQDITLPNVLISAMMAAITVNSPIRHVNILKNTRDMIIQWQHNNIKKVKIPSSESSKERLSE